MENQNIIPSNENTELNEGAENLNLPDEGIEAKVLDVIEEGWDPKNRSVKMFADGEKFIVTKEYTGFKAEVETKEEAEMIFDFQITCSQNQ